MKQLLILILSLSLYAAPVSDKYAKLLTASVCESGVNYELLTSSPHLTETEKEFLAVSKEEFLSWNESEQIAWYSNLYNFYTIKLIVDHYPLKSINKIGKPWDKKIVPLFGKKVSLNHVEHEILRKDFYEPRIHFALNCASIGCPPLRTAPFTGNNLSLELDEMALTFLTDKNRNRLDGKALYLSKIFQWYGDDFNKAHGSYEKYVKKVLGIEKKVKVKFLEYDWNLNSSNCSK